MWNFVTNSLHFQETDEQNRQGWAKPHNECNVKAGMLGSLSCKSVPTLEQSENRNEQLLKDFEISKARLRTYASYTPTDQQLRQLASSYRTSLKRMLEKEIT